VAETTMAETSCTPYYIKGEWSFGLVANKIDRMCLYLLNVEIMFSAAFIYQQSRDVRYPMENEQSES
jgi:hypothetical protein